MTASPAKPRRGGGEGGSGALSSITIFSKEHNEDESFTFVLMKTNGSGKHLANAVAAAFGLTPDAVLGVRDTRGALFSFDTVVQDPSLFEQGRYALATHETPSTLLAPGSLAHVKVEDFVRAFREYVGRDGTLSRDAFTRCLRSLSPNSRLEDIHNLFAKFDLDGNGLVDGSEFVSGGVVLCGGDQDTKIKLSFAVLDRDGNGALDEEEITQYMTSVFRIVANASPQAFAESSPEALARVTAQSAMAFAAPGTKALTYEQFRAWMLSSEQGDEAAARKQAARRPLDLNRIKALTGLAELELDQVIDIFIDESNEDGAVDRQAFARALSEICRAARRDFSKVEQSDMDALFQAVDVNGDGTCDVEEIASAFSLLCQGTRDERCMSVFHLFDADGDGYLDVEEMGRLLSSVFRILFAATPALSGEMGGISADELGGITAEDALRSLDLDGDGRVSFAEFRQWYTRPSALQNSTQDEDEEQGEEAWLTLNEARRLTGLGAYTPALVMEAFALVADEDGMVPRRSFFDTFARLMPRDKLSQLEVARAQAIQRKLYSLYAEEDAGGRVDFGTLATALAMLCGGGGEEEKKRSVFELMDLDRSGTVEREEFERFMIATMQVLFLTQPRVAREIGVTANELALAVTEDAFAKFDANLDGRLSFDEFSQYWAEDGMVDMGGGSGGVAATCTSKRSLEQVREILALSQYSAEDLFEAIAYGRKTGEEEGVTREHFCNVLGALAKQHRELSRQELALVDREVDSLYTMFDTDRNGMVDFTELAVGLSLLSGGTADSRAEAAFRLFQSPQAQDGTITLQGMVDYLTVMFRTMQQVGGSEAQAHFANGETAEELALATAHSVFTEADLNQDGTLSFDEWKRFYNAPAAQEVREMVQRVHVPVQEIKHRTGLAKMLPEEVFEHFAHAADENGELSRAAFVAVFERIAPLPHDARLHLCIDSLFSLLDEDGNDRVDYVELSTGLSVLTMGSKKDKLRSAFALLDLDGSGTIDEEELERYCASVYRIMFSDPASQERLLGGKSIAQHARDTAREVMSSPTLRRAGELTLQEFIQWIEGGEDAAAIVTNNEIGQASQLSLPELANVLGMSKHAPQDLFEHFAHYASKSTRALSRNSFLKAVRALQQEKQDGSQALRANLAANRVFDCLDANGDGAVDFSELSAGVSILSAGSADDKVRAAFALYDTDGNGYIDLAEMTAYLTSVYKVTLLAQPDPALSAAGLTPERIAEVTAKEIFKTCDLNGDGMLSFDEFRTWYTTTTSSAEEDAETETESEEEVSAAHTTGLDVLSPSQAFALILRFADARTGRITRTGLVQALKSLHKGPLPAHFVEACTRLHAMFDTDRDGAVDLQELAVGLSLVLNPHGAFRDTEALFDVFANRSDYITLPQLEYMLETVFKLLLASEDGASIEIARGSSPRELAVATAQSIFSQADANADGLISRSEFAAFCHDTVSGQALQGLVHDTESLLDLGGMDGLRRITGLDSRDALQIMQFVARATSNGSRELTPSQFYSLLQSIAPENTATSGELKLVSQRLFQALDVDLNQRLSENELNAGLFILCKGNKFKRAMDAFALYDLDKDGYLTLDELFFYLRSSFRVLQVAEPGKYAAVNADQLALETAHQILAEADTSGDGRISLDEFLEWTDLGELRTSAAPALKAAGVATLGEARALLGLTNVSPEQLFESLAQRADDRGEISRRAFAASLLEFAPDARRARPMLDKLFDLLDLNKSGALDFCEVAGGMSILVGGEKMDKVRAACRLFDANGDGFISREEMLAYLTSVFTIILATRGGNDDNLDARALASATCDDAFAAADLNHDGRLDYNEFAAWILADDAGGVVRAMVDPLHEELNLEQIRVATGLGAVSPAVLVQSLARFANARGELDRASFARAFHSFATNNNSAAMGRVSDARVLVQRLFDLLDVNGDGVVSAAELTAGLSVLCKGTREEKTRAAFQAFAAPQAQQQQQQEEDGEMMVLDFDQITLLLESVFRLLLVAGGEGANVEAVAGASPEELALSTALECFAEKDLARTGYVSARDFHEFFDLEG